MSASYTVYDSHTVITVNNQSGNSSFSLDIDMTVADDNASSGNYDIKIDSVVSGSFDLPATGIGNSALICSDTVTGSENELLNIPIRIENCSGLMGYRLTFEYDKTKVRPIAIYNVASCGGNFADDLVSSDGSFSVVWNNSDPMTEDGDILLLNVQLLGDEDADIVISYSSEDTFDGNWNDFSLICLPVHIKAAPAVVVTPGDVNGDGKFTSKDISLLKRVIAGTAAEGTYNELNADVNGDGKFTSKDISTLKKIIAQG